MNDQELLLAAGRGDRQAFLKLMTKHMSFAMGLAMRMSGNTADAEDIVQEAFLRAWTHAAQWRTDGGAQFSTWLYRVVVNLCLDRKRRPTCVSVDSIEEPQDSRPSGLEVQSTTETQEIVAEALASLPPRQRAAVSLCYFEGLGYQDAAEIMNITPSALDSLLVRGRKALRDHLLRRGFDTLGDVL